jgi:hypothetical protein
MTPLSQRTCESSVNVVNLPVLMRIYRFPTTKEVQKENDARLDKLKGKPETYIAHDVFGQNDLGEQLSHAKAVDLLNKNLIAPDIITLKVQSKTCSALSLTDVLSDRRAGDVN